MKYEIIDFHTHPFVKDTEILGNHKEYVNSNYKKILDELKRAGINKFAGSVISTKKEDGAMKNCNDAVLLLKEYFTTAYIPGFTVDARYVEESKGEIDRAITEGINLIGELVPYHYSWKYSDKGFAEILDYCDNKGLIFSLHTNYDEIDVMGRLAKEHPSITFVFAHPGEINQLKKHIEIMKSTPNVYLDLSGTGLFRYGMLKRLASEVGADRILFGTDYPICNPGMYVGGVDYEDISDEEKRLIYSENAKRILGIK